MKESTVSDEELRSVVVDALLQVAPEVQPAGIDPSANFRDQIDFDSLDYLNFALLLEKRLGIRIPELEYPRLSSLDGCVAYLRSRTGGVPAERRGAPEAGR